jgi:hypothetical protein
MEPFVAEPFVALMRRYCIDYTARHDLSVCDDIMVPGYTLHMGVHRLAGRDKAYKPAAAAQFRQFPGLCLTVNEIICSGDRLALRFTEHGASVRHDGARAAWGGVGLYRWDGQRLLENHVEQDYFGRRRQLAGDGPDPVEPPAVAPWDTRSVRADLAAEAVVRGWLAAGDLTGVIVDDGHPAHRLVAAGRTDISVLFSAGPRVAFHAVRHGPLIGEDPRFTGDGEAMLHLAGVVRVAGGQVAGGRVITDRLGLLRRLAQAAGQAGP